MKHPNIIISGTGSYIPEKIVSNDSFLGAEFYDEKGVLIPDDQATIIRKFEKITGIKERRYALDQHIASDLAYFAGKAAIEDAGIDPEQLDYIIVAHNFGDIPLHSGKVDILPGLAAKVKGQLGLKNPDIVCYDIIFGCPGWVQGCIQAYQMILSGFCRHVLVIGADTLSRVIDPHDRDSMIFSDGAGAAVVSASFEPERRGILGFANRTDANEEVDYLKMGPSYKPGFRPEELYIKMQGRKIYEYALNLVADGMQVALKRANVGLEDIKKILIHQANEKMDEAILKKLGSIYHMDLSAHDIMPMTIGYLGNSSVATVPTMLDMILKKQLEGHQIEAGDQVILASVGAGMHINAIVYRF
jgi:3-oxoacyl-[acyl-carrier-protein] synthase III